MDGDEGRGGKRGSSFEASREMLAKYKAEVNAIARGNDTRQLGDPSDEELLHNDTGGQSMEQQGNSMTEGMSSRDITQSSMSVSEGEGDGDLEGMAGRVAELEELLQDKEAVVEALSAEIDHLRAEASSPNSSQSHNSSTQSKDILLVYHTKLQDFERAVNQRDNLIHDLTSSLEQALSARDALKAQLQSMCSNELVTPDMGNFIAAQDRIASLESALVDHKTLISQLNGELIKSRELTRKLEIEKEAQNSEINDYKIRVNQLNEQIRAGAVENTLNIAETMEMQKQYESRVDKIKKDMQIILEKFTAETNTKSIQHEEAIKSLEMKHQRESAEMRSKYEEQYRNLADRYNSELPDLETKHAKELSVFQGQLSSYKKTVEALKLELMNRSESQRSIVTELDNLREKLQQNQRDKEMLNEQINLHKVQLEDLTSKYVAAASVLDSKESIERSLEEALTNVAQLRLENDALKFKYDDLSARYSAAQSLIENSQVHERSMNNRIYDLEKSLSRLSGVSASMLSEFNETTYQTFDEVAVQFHMTKQKLDEKAEMERQLIDKIRSLEEQVNQANDRLNLANLEKESYEKQIKDMKNTCDKLRTETDRQDSNLPELFQSSTYFSSEKSGKSPNKTSDRRDISGEEIAKKFETYEREISELRNAIERKDHDNAEAVKKFSDLTEKLETSEAECERLKNGIAMAWEQCAEFEEKLNKTLAMNETRFADSSTFSRDDFNDSSRVTNETLKNSKQLDTTEKNIQTDEKSHETIDRDAAEHDTRELDVLRSENEKLKSEVTKLSERISSLEDATRELEDTKLRVKKFEKENEELRSEIERSMKDRETIDQLKKSIEDLETEKIALNRELSNIREKHREELAAVRTDSTSEMEKLRNLMMTVKEGDNGLAELKNELEKRHAKEMEELRTYFEEKCLQMEKQYSDEIFSQQSKKMSDNDSEIEDLAEDLYCGGGDYTNNKNRVNNENSKDENCLDDVDTKIYRNDSNAIVDSGLVTAVNQLSQTEWDCALENGELTKLRAAYSNQLEEQVALAKLDIVNALQEQIQALLAVETDMEDHWPSELLELRNKFTNNAKREIEELRAIHTSELKQLRDEHSRNVARIHERHQDEVNKITMELETQRERSKTKDCNSNIDADIVRERDNLFKTCVTLKELLVDLTKYFAVCEEELNNTLISEVLKRQISNDESSSKIFDNERNEIDTTDFREIKSPETRVKRVHFAPQCSQIESILNIDTNMLRSFNETDDNVIDKIRCELEGCLKRMKSESAQVLGITVTPGETMLDVLSKQVLWTTKVNEELSAKLSDAENIALACQDEARILRAKVANLQHSLMAIENKKEIVSEGYGEHEESGGELVIQDFSQLQEKARQAIMSGIADNAYLLQLIEELCRYNDKITDETRKEKEDLQQQIEAADKQLRATRKFLEEQASEREIERDDAARQIEALQEQVKEREREKERDLRITSESSLSPVSSPVVRVLQTDISAAVEALELQMREMSSLMSDTEAKKNETESELKVAVDKIWVLRDIIVDLEQQIQARVEKEEALLGQIEQLEEVIAAQTKNQHELAQELDAIKMGGENSQLNEHITHLEEELRKHKLSTEHFNVNSTALKQMKIELRDMQNQLDKRTRELESLHMCGSNLSLSQPSEDVSIREQIEVARCPTPDDPNSPPMLPLDQLLKLKEKMLKHARAEEVAFKRIKDLDMQLSTLKIQNEELQAEQEILQQTASEQLFQMEAMRGRLEHQKQSAPFAQRQATSRLELQLHEANAKFHSLEQRFADKELEVNETKEQLQRVNKLLQEKQKEFMDVVQTENNAIQELKDRLKTLEQEKKLLESKVGVQERAQVELPQLIDSMLADKNEEIDHLKEQLSKRDKQLQVYLSANMEDNQLTKQTEAKNSARTLSDILSINSECEDYSEAIREGTTNMSVQPHNISTFKVSGELRPAKDSYQVSPPVTPLETIEKSAIHVPHLELGSSHSQSFSSTCPRHSRVSLDLLQTTDFDVKSSSLGETLESPLNHEKSNGTVEPTCNCHLDQSSKTHSKKSPPSSLATKTAVKSLRSAANAKNRDSRYQDLEDELKKIRYDLDEKSSMLEKREIELAALQREIEELRLEFKETCDGLSRDKDFYKNQYELSRASESKIRRDLEEVENTLKQQSEESNDYRSMIQVNEKILSELRAENDDLRKRAESQAEINKTYENALMEKTEETKNLRDVLFDKDVTIESVQTRCLEIESENKKLYEYKTRYDQCKKELVDSKSEIQRLTEMSNNRDRMIRRLEEMARTSVSSSLSTTPSDKDQEIHHLQEYLREKEKVIRQMSDDSKSLHRALETIQNKMKESGNVVELRKKLKDERRFNGELKEMVEKLRNELESLKDDAVRQSVEGADIEDMVQRELDISARLDRQIMDVIESENEETATGRRMEKHSCNSLTIKPSEHDRTERIMEKYSGVRQRLKQALRSNDELSKLRDDFEIEREMLRAQLNEYETRIFQLNSDIDEKTKRIADLENEISSRRIQTRSLEQQLNREKIASQTSHMHDSELISQLRVKLVASLDSEEKTRREFAKLREEHENLESQLNNVRTRITEEREISETNKTTKILENERARLTEMVDKYDKEKRQNDELRDSVKRLETENKRLERDLEIAIEEQDKLASNLALADSAKDHLEIEVKRSKEELKSRDDECEWLQKRIKTLNEALAKRQRQTSDEQTELKSLRRGMSNAREVMLDLEADIDQAKSQLAKANEERSQLAQWVQTLTYNETELKRKIENAKEEEERLKETINDLQSELQMSVKREMEVTDELQKERLSGDKNVPAKFVQRIKELNETVEKYSRDKSVLHEKLIKAREEREIFVTRAHDLESQLEQKTREATNATSGHLSPHMAEKLQHFYGKYLRVDSRRKALAYQKRYLLCIVGGYQMSEQSTLSILAQLTHEQRAFTTSSANRKSGRVRFRCAALVIIAIHRMKWMILRWRTGRRVGANAVLGNLDQSFVPIRRSVTNHSPPVRERPAPSGNGNPGGFSLELYLHRFMDIQQTLGLALPDPD